MKKPKGEYSIQTVSNAMRLFEAFRDEPDRGVTELSTLLKLHKNNVFRLLATLEEQGYVEQCANDRYRLAVKTLELGQSYARNAGLLERGRSTVRRLVEETGEAAHLGVLHSFEVVHVEGHACEQLVMTTSRRGTRLPVHCTALGKVLLGFGSEELRQRFDREVVVDGRLQARTADTIDDAHKFFDHLSTAVAHRGYALDLGECEAGLFCAAAPVYAEDGEVVAALSISGPSFRLDEGRLLDDMAPRVCIAAEQLSRELGHAHPEAS